MGRTNHVNGKVSLTHGVFVCDLFIHNKLIHVEHDCRYYVVWDVYLRLSSLDHSLSDTGKPRLVVYIPRIFYVLYGVSQYR